MNLEGCDMYILCSFDYTSVRLLHLFAARKEVSRFVCV